jgi:hypothetical protein
MSYNPDGRNKEDGKKIRMVMDNLFLILKSEWYYMIEADIKKEEYRDMTDYWRKRLDNRQYNWGTH